MSTNPIKSPPPQKASVPSLPDTNSGLHVIFLYEDVVRLLHEASTFTVTYSDTQRRYKPSACSESGVSSSMASQREPEVVLVHAGPCSS